jgi:hypothetical protein
MPRQTSMIGVSWKASLPDAAGAAGVALGHEAAALLVPRQDGAQPVLEAR